MNHKHILFAGTAAIALTLGHGAYAQTSPAPGAKISLDEIVVTARKREETLSSVPDQVSVVSAKTLAQKNVQKLGNLQNLVPAFSFNNIQDPFTVYMSMRGINSVRNSENPVALVVDGVQSNDATQINQQLVDVERIEILEGPQGALYGRNAVGGAINIVTKKPTDTYSGEVKLTYENGDERDGSFSLSGPLINDKLLFRIGGSIQHYGGLIENGELHTKADSSKSQNAYAKLYYDPTPNLSIALRASYFLGYANAYYYKLVPIGNINKESGYPVLGNPQGLTENSDKEVSAKIDYRLPWFTITSITGWSNNYNLLDGDLDIQPTLDGQLGERFVNRSINEDLKVTSNGSGALQWLAGAYYLDKKQQAINPVYLGPAIVGPGFVDPRQLGVSYGQFFDTIQPAGSFLLHRTSFNFTDRAYAAYGQASYDFTKQINLTLGVRYDVEDRNALNNGTLDGDGTTVFAAPVDIAKYRSNQFSSVQPKATLSYKFLPDQMAYATYSTGFRSGGYNNTVNTHFGEYPAETVTNYEVGEKSSLFGGILRTELSAFYEDEKNRPDFFFDVQDSTQNIFPIAKSWIDGVELSGTIRPMRGLTINTSLTLMDSKITQLNAEDIYINTFDGLSPNAGLGKHLSYIYHDQFKLSLQYDRALSDKLNISLGLDYSYMARNWFWYTNNGFQQSPLSLVNGQLGFTYNKNWELKFFVVNMFNVNYVLEHDPSFAFGFAEDPVFPAPPRRFGMSLAYKF